MRKRKAVAIAFSAIAGTAVLGIMSCAGFLYLGYQDASREAGPRIDALFSALRDGSFPGTYERLTSEELRNAVSKDEWVALGRTVDLRLGDLKSKSLNSFQTRKLLKGAYLDVTYKAEFENGPGVILAKLKKEKGEWRFMGFRVNSPVFDQDFVTAECPACGEPHKPRARFCPACGERLVAHADGKDSTEPTRPPEPAAEPGPDRNSSPPAG